MDTEIKNSELKSEASEVMTDVTEEILAKVSEAEETVDIYKGEVKDLEDLDKLLLEDQAEDEEYKKRREERRRTARENREKPTLMQEILSWVIPIGLALVISLFLKSFVIISAKVPTGSMENTIMPGDNLFGYRLAYRHADPQRGDIVIFYYPDNEEKKYIKRIIGLPGETVIIDQAQIYIDGSEFPLYEDYLKEEWVNGSDYFEFHVPEDSYLMLGDNRNTSEDARYWDTTYVTRDKIIAKAEFVYFPFDHFGAIGKANY